MDPDGERVAVDGGYLTAWRSGHGAPVILCHGGPGLWDYTRPIADLFTDVAEIVRFDQRGCGRSRCGPPYTLDRAVSDVEAVRQHFQIASPILAGHSWGASLCLAYALRHPSRVRGILYLSGTGSDPNWVEGFRKRRNERLTDAGRLRLQELWGRLTESPPDTQGPTLREYAELAWPLDFGDTAFGQTQVSVLLRDGAIMNTASFGLADEASAELVGEVAEPRLRSIRSPVLVIHGTADPRPIGSAERLASLLPKGRFVGLPGVGHHAALEAPDQLRDLLRSFVREVGDPRPSG